MKRVVQGYQRGCLRVRNGCFELLYRDCIVGSDGRIHRPRRTVRLGPEEIGTREAERLRDEVLAKINNQKEARREITFGEFVNGPFFETKLPALSKNCQDNYRHLLRRHVMPVFEHRQLSEISREHVRRFLIGRGTTFSWNTVRNIRACLSSVFALAIEDGSIANNPAGRVKIGREPAREPYFIPPREDLSRLKALLPYPYGVIAELLEATGLRGQEGFALQWGDLDFDRGMIHVCRALSKGEVGPPKSKYSRRAIPMSENLRRILAEYRSRLTATGPSDWLFPNEGGTGPVSLNNSRSRVVARLVRELKLPKLGWHTFRHVFATRGAEAGVPLRVMQELLGHSSPLVTAKYYQHISDRSLREAVEKAAAA